ncbi:MAG: lysylphosphatidylglycerol synthase transmembrane domain-containing protein [Xenococcaceae cyanobacterium MO_188.B29]|nr:lysylphosphatidylglycerol synthase transmembrane domain-containing protein [Xenococcaceae cyanobacterium MO_188.B29]
MANISRSPISGRSWLRGLIGLALGALFFWLALRQTSWTQVQTILSQAENQWLVIAMGFYAANIVVRVVRWRSLLWDIKPLSFRSVGIVLVVGYAMNNILPARLGELFRANFAGRRYRLSRLAIAGSIVVERVLDGLILVLCLILGQLFITQKTVLLSSLTTAGGMLFSGIFLILWVSSRSSQKNLTIPLLPLTFTKKIQGFCTGLAGLRGMRLAEVTALSLMVWLLEGMAQWSVLKAIGLSLNWQQMLSVLGLVNLSTLIPSAPGFVGTYQYAYALAVGLFGYPSAEGVAAATAAQVFLLGGLTLVGIGLYFYLNLLKPRVNLPKQ